MRFSPGFRAALVALFALTGAGTSSAAHADSGSIQLWELKGGWIIGASGGGGTLIFHGRRYPLSIGGLSAGLVFGASETRLYGRVSNIRYPSDVAGVYGGAGAGPRCWSARGRSVRRKGRRVNAVRPAGRFNRQCRP